MSTNMQSILLRLVRRVGKCWLFRDLARLWRSQLAEQRKSLFRCAPSSLVIFFSADLRHKCGGVVAIFARTIQLINELAHLIGKIAAEQLPIVSTTNLEIVDRAVAPRGPGMMHPADPSNFSTLNSQNNLSSAGYTHLIGQLSGEACSAANKPSTLMAEQSRLNDTWQMIRPCGIRE